MTRPAERSSHDANVRWEAGLLLGAVRGVMAERGFRGPVASLLLLDLVLIGDWALEATAARGAGPPRRGVGEQLVDVLPHAAYAFATGLVADRFVRGPLGATLSSGRRIVPAGAPGAATRRDALPKAGMAATARIISTVLAPTLAKGPIIRRPTAEGMAEGLGFDRKAIRTMQRLRTRFGRGPLLLRNPLRPRRHMALILSPDHVHRVLDASPEPFATATFEKRGALAHFEPGFSLISRGHDRAERVRFNAEVLDTQRPEHRLAGDFLRVLDEEAEEMLAVAQRGGDLSWGDFIESWYRMVRRVVFGDPARDDVELMEMLTRLRSRANWSFLAPQNRVLRQRFLERVRSYLVMAEPGSLASLVAGTAKTDRTAPEHQVPQWLFAFDPAAMATFRALALLATHPTHATRARQEIRASAGDGDRRLPFLRACILESLRLWPTTPLVLRETTGETWWDGAYMPAHTLVVTFAPFFHRDDQRLPYADRFTPEIWLEDGSAEEMNPLSSDEWPLIPFSSGPGMCPGRHLVLLLCSRMLAALLDDRQIRLKPVDRLSPHHPLPGTLNHYSLRFELGARAAESAKVPRSHP